MKTSAPNQTPKRKRAPNATVKAAARPVAAPASTVIAKSVAQPPKAVAKAAATPTIALTSNCTIKEAAGLKQSLCALVDAEEAVTLDATSVERVDTAILQLLCAFVRARAAANRMVTWRGEDSAVSDAARLLGLQQLLGLPAAGAMA